MNPIALHLDKSSPTRLHLERADGTPADLEEAFTEGFVIRPDDANAVLTLAATFCKTRGEYAL